MRGAWLSGGSQTAPRAFIMTFLTCLIDVTELSCHCHHLPHDVTQPWPGEAQRPAVRHERARRRWPTPASHI
jgi:hypothetical protein